LSFVSVLVCVCSQEFATVAIEFCSVGSGEFASVPDHLPEPTDGMELSITYRSQI